MNLETIFEGSKKALLETLEQAFCQEGQKVILLARECVGRIKAGGKVLIFGNGGSAADAQHVAAEFVNRFRMERAPLPAMALTTDTSIITSIGNDYDFSDIFSKQVKALATPRDIVLGISTSGTSPNVIKALDEGRAIGAYTVLLAGRGGEGFKQRFDLVLSVPSTDTPRIQEVHLFFEHMLCEFVERIYFGERHDRSH